MFQWILVLITAYMAYRLTGSWLGTNSWMASVAVVVVYLIASTMYRKSREHSDRVKGALIVSMPLSAEEKIHMEAIGDRNQRLAKRGRTGP